MTTDSPLFIALTVSACLSLLAAKPAAADHSGIIIQTETLVMEGKRKQLDEAGGKPTPAWDKETVTVTDRLIFTGIRNR